MGFEFSKLLNPTFANVIRMLLGRSLLLARGTCFNILGLERLLEEE